MVRMNKRTVGGEYEKRAAKFLERQGYRILERNYRNRRGEIDLVGREGGYLVFIEVKYRQNAGTGSALGAVDLRKQQKISKAALFYRMERKIPDEMPCRFDVVGVDGEKITLVKNAFDFCAGGFYF